MGTKQIRIYKQKYTKKYGYIPSYLELIKG